FAPMSAVSPIPCQTLGRECGAPTWAPPFPNSLLTREIPDGPSGKLHTICANSCHRFGSVMRTSPPERVRRHIRFTGVIGVMPPRSPGQRRTPERPLVAHTFLWRLGRCPNAAVIVCAPHRFSELDG